MRIFLALTLVAGWATFIAAQGTVVTQRGPQSAEKLVSLRRDMSWAEALEMIQGAAAQVIVYHGAESAQIGVNVFQRPWQEALQVLLDANNLQRVEREGFWEIVAPPGGENKEAPDFGLRSRQIQISAVFFVADRSALREVGIDWSTIGGGVVEVASDVEDALSRISGTEEGAASALRGASRVDSDFFEVGGSQTFTVGGEKISVQALLRAFESNHLGQVISRPLITVVDGRSGLVFVGRDFATTTSDFAGNAITRFHQTGTNLVVTARVISESGIDFVHLTLEAERSSLLDPVRQIIDKTNTSTEVLLYDGEETAIAGLFQIDRTEVRQGVPFLKDLPWWLFGLRYVFGHNSLQETEKELVIILQAKIMPTIDERIQTRLEQARPPALERAHREFDQFKTRAVFRGL